MSAKEIAKAKSQIELLNEFRESKAVDLGRQSEMLMSSQTHMCNIGLKAGLLQPEKGIKLKNPKTGMIHICKTS